MKQKQIKGLTGCHPEETKKDIHALLEETIAERKSVLPPWEKLFLYGQEDTANDIHAQLKKTIAEFKQSMRQYESFFTSKKAA
ncbi:MAG: hypothetical protein EPN92_11865 [Chitinophagaceae bacterium]|nr:MAG: hypothetical protein EPN92_11865 [Chitinophagaceae bacterium]